MRELTVRAFGQKYSFYLGIPRIDGEKVRSRQTDGRYDGDRLTVGMMDITLYFNTL